MGADAKTGKPAVPPIPLRGVDLWVPTGDLRIVTRT